MTRTYELDCQIGRQQAARAIEDSRLTGNLPRLVREIQAMAVDDTGVGVGFLYALGKLLGLGVTDD